MDEPAGADVPGGHAVQAVEPPPEKVSAGQTVHAGEPPKAA